MFTSSDKKEFTSKLNVETKFSAELVEASCILMNSFNSTPRQKLKRLREEMCLKDFRTKPPFKIFRFINHTMREKPVQLDHRKEQDHRKNLEVHQSTTAKEELKIHQVQESWELRLNKPFMFENYYIYIIYII